MSTTSPNSDTTLNVDTNNEVVELQFVDDRGNQTSPPQGATVTFSDPSGVVTFQVAPDNPFRATLVPTGTPGTAQLTATVSGFNGPDGNPVPNPAPVSVQVNPGAAVGERLVVSEAASVQPPAPAPAPDPGTAPATDPNAPSAPIDPATPTPTPTPDPTAPATTPTDPSVPTPATAPTTTATDSSQLDRSVYTHAAGPVSNDPNWPDSGYVTGDGNNSPLYYFSGDSAPGQANGNGADGGAWEFYTGPIQTVA